MTMKNTRCSPPNLETTTNLVWKGADVYSTAYGISIPAPGNHGQLEYPDGDAREPDPGLGKRRNYPVIWQARQILGRQGLIAVPVRSGSPYLPDIVAWDRNTLSLITVRRSRTPAPAREVAIRYDPLIQALRQVPVPGNATLQLWIRLPRSFQVYEILDGGLMSRGIR